MEQTNIFPLFILRNSIKLHCWFVSINILILLQINLSLQYVFIINHLCIYSWIFLYLQVFTSEDYFDRQYSKTMTSSHTLKQLKTPRLAHSQLTSLLKMVPNNHEKSLGFLNGGIKNSFRHWLFCFRSVLFFCSFYPIKHFEKIHFLLSRLSILFITD